MQNNGVLNTSTPCQVISLNFDTMLDRGLTPMFQRNILPPYSGWENYMHIQ